MIPAKPLSEDELRIRSQMFKEAFLKAQQKCIADILNDSSFDRLYAVMVRNPFSFSDASSKAIVSAPKISGLIKELESGLFLVEGVQVGSIYETKDSWWRETRTIEERIRINIYDGDNHIWVYEQKFMPNALMIPVYRQ